MFNKMKCALGWHGWCWQPTMLEHQCVHCAKLK